MPDEQSTEYTVEDWLQVLQVFEGHPALELPHSPDHGLQEILKDQASRQGGTLTYYVTDTSAEFQLEYSFSQRDEDNQLLWGIIGFNGDFQDEILEDTYQEIAEAHTTEYLQPSEGIYNLAELSIPENYNPESLENSIQEGIELVQEAEQLQAQLKRTLDEYSPK